MNLGDVVLGQQSKNAFSTIVSFSQEYLKYLSAKDTFQQIATDAFGDRLDAAALSRLTAEWQRNDFSSLPSVELRSSGEMQGAYGAYAAQNNTIYISQTFIEQNASQPQKLVEVMLEELGHFLDASINTEDSPGDEGAIFASLAAGKTLTESEYNALRREDDSAVFMLGAQAIEVEQANPTVSDSGGFEGSQQTLNIGSKNGATIEYRYEHFFIPDNFIIRYEGKNVFETGFTGGSQSGKIKLPKGNSESLEIIVATNDSGTAWNYTVTAIPCADTSPLVVEAANGSFEDTDDDGDCDATGTVTIGHTSGPNEILRIQNADAEYDDKSIRIKSGTTFAAVGGVSESLFSGDFEIPTGTTKATAFNVTPGTFKLGGLDTEFQSLVMLSDGAGFGTRFQLPNELGNIIFDSLAGSGSPDSLIFTQNGVRLGSSGKVSIANVPKFSFFGLFDVNASDVSLSYKSPENQLKFQGKFELDSFVKDTFVKKITADLSGNNFAQVEDGKADLVGSLKVDTDLKTSKGWGLSSIELKLDTVKKEVGGVAEVTFPFKAKIPNAKFDLGFKTTPFGLDRAVVTVGNLNLPIPQAPAVFLQSLKGGVDNLAPGDSDPIEFIGGAGFTLGPKTPQIELFLGTSAEVKIPSASLFKLDLDGKINENRAVGTGKAVLVSDKILSSTGEITVNWDKKFYEFKGSKSLLDGLISTNDNFKLNSNFDFTAGGGARVGVPKFIPLVGGSTLGSGDYLLKFTNDSNYSNDYGAAWGTINIGAFGFGASLTAGFKAFFNGRFERIGARNIPSASRSAALSSASSRSRSAIALNAAANNSFSIQPGTDFFVMGVDWENATSADVPITVTLPDGTVLTESEFNASNRIAVVDELSDETTKAVVVFNPQPGLWSLQVTDPTGLGQLSYTAVEESEMPTLDVLTPAATVTDSLVNIEYSAFDADSDAEISLFFDNDSSGFDGVQIADGLLETDGTGSFLWNTEGFAPGDYFIYGLAVDENNPPVFDYAPGKVVVTEATEVSVTQTVDDASILPGEEFTYTITVENNSSTTAKGLVLNEVLPDEVTVISTSVAPTSQTGNAFVFDLGDFAGSAKTEIDIKVLAPSTPGRFSGSATLNSRTYDSDLTNDIDLFTTVIEELPAPALPDLVVTRTDRPGDVAAGDRFTYTLQVTNNGGKADTVVLEENFDSGLRTIGFTPVGSTSITNLGATNTSFTLGLGELESGETAEFEVEVESRFAGNFTNTTEVTSTGQGDENVFDNLLTSAKLISGATPSQVDLELVQVADTLTPDVGDAVNFTLTLTNNGPGIASGILVQDALAPELTFVSAIAEQGVYDAVTGIWDVGNVRDNLSRSITISATVNAAGQVNNTAEVIAVNEVDVDSTPNNGVESEDDQETLALTLGTIPGPNPPGPRPNRKPVAEDDIFATDEDSILSGNVLNDNGNGRDRDGDGDSLIVTQVGGNSSAVGQEIALGEGTLTVNRDGTFTFDPNGGYDALVAGTSTVESIAYGIDDSNGGVSTATIEITINGKGTAPSLTVNGKQATVFVDNRNRVVGNAFQAGQIYRGELFTNTDAQFNTGNSPDDVVRGTEGNDNIWTGVKGRDTIAAGAGNDIIGFGSGNSWVSAGSGDDFVYAAGSGNGDNIIDLGSGSDSFYVFTGNNNVTGTGDNLISVGAGNDTVTTFGGRDFVYSLNGGGRDALDLGDGDNVVWVEFGDYSIRTGAGNDSIGLGNGSDTVSAGAGNNFVYMVNANGTTDGAKDVVTGAGDDYIQTGSGDDLIDAGAGLNSLYGQGGADVFVMRSGAYNFIGDFEPGTDRIDLEGLSFGRLSFFQGTGSTAADAFIFSGSEAIGQVANTAVEDISQQTNFV